MLCTVRGSVQEKRCREEQPQLSPLRRRQKWQTGSDWWTTAELALSNTLRLWCSVQRMGPGRSREAGRILCRRWLTAQPESVEELGRFCRRSEERKATARGRSLNQDLDSIISVRLVTPPHPIWFPSGSYLQQSEPPPPGTKVLS